MVKQGSNQAIRFFVYENMKHWFQGDDYSKSIGMLRTALCGATAGAASVFGNTPVDVVKTRMQVGHACVRVGAASVALCYRGSTHTSTRALGTA